MDFTKLLKARPIIAEHLRQDFGAFCRAAWPHLHAGSKLSWTPAHDLISEYLIAAWQGQFKRLIINCPPRFAKSSIVTILWPIWLWLQSPTLSFLCCSYEIDLATNHNLDRKRLMDGKWFRDLFGNFFELATERSQAGEFSNTAGGTMQAASVNSKAQGRGGDYVVVDDPLSADQAFSESFRNETNSWFSHQLPQRLNNPNESRIVIVAQRLHQNDPCGFLLSQEETEWTLLKLALIAEEDETWTFPISGRVWTRKKGSCLDPRRWSPRVVKERQRNRLVFAGQFQQEPMAVEGNLIHTNEIQYFGGKDPQTGIQDGPLPERFDRRVISVDCSFKDKPSSDYVAIVVVGVVGARRYLLHVTNAHLDLTGTENEIRNAHAAFGPISATLVEDKANGSAVISHLKDQIPGLIAINPEGGKLARVMATSPEFQAHDWYIARHGAWSHKVVEQLTMFPNAKNDDITDAITQCAVWLQANSVEYGVIGLLRDIFTGKRKMPAAPDEIKRATNPAAAQTRVEGNKGQVALPVGPCTLCGGPLVWKPGGNPNNPWVSRCQQCHAEDGQPAGGSELGCAVGCAGFVRQIVSGRVRCGNCGSFHSAAPPTLGAVSRAQYAAQRSSFPEWDRLERFLK